MTVIRMMISKGQKVSVRGRSGLSVHILVAHYLSCGRDIFLILHPIPCSLATLIIEKLKILYYLYLQKYGK